MITLPPDFKDFLQLLNDHKVKYLLVGGYAVALHGYVRYTGGMDIWIMTSAENVVNVLTDFGIPQADELRDIFLIEKQVLGMGIQPYKIEVITTIDGVTFEGCYPNRITVEIDSVLITYLSLKDLRINKKASGRYKVLDDLQHLPEE